VGTSEEQKRTRRGPVGTSGEQRGVVEDQWGAEGSRGGPVGSRGEQWRTSGEQRGAEEDQWGAGGAEGGSCTTPVQAAGLEQIRAQIVIESDGKRI